MFPRGPRPKYVHQQLAPTPDCPTCGDQQEPRIRIPRMGDVVHGATRRLGMKHCAKCQQRKQGMNSASEVVETKVNALFDRVFGRS